MKEFSRTLSKRILIAGGFVWSALVGCVSQGKYDALKEENAALHHQVATQTAQSSADQAQITRLQGAIKYTVNSDLLFPPGSWEMSAEGKDTIAKMAAKLAPTQENRLVVNGYTDNSPIGPALEQQGVTSNEILSQKRAEAVKQFLISQGVDPNLVTAVGHGDADPIATNESAKGRSQNRRVELTLGG